MSISEISIKRPIATAMFYIGVILLGIVSLTQLPVDLLPNLSYPKLTIRTFYTDIPPTEIEKLITIPIEEAA
ncbi:MAG TPA: efflux RND transporter permease subunit, partial [Bacteroidetes bacterium]|nr:efflux RND transporter permease subunit [Bacteroidota bacterium]